MYESCSIQKLCWYLEVFFRVVTSKCIVSSLWTCDPKVDPLSKCKLFPFKWKQLSLVYDKWFNCPFTSSSWKGLHLWLKTINNIEIFPSLAFKSSSFFSNMNCFWKDLPNLPTWCQLCNITVITLACHCGITDFYSLLELQKWLSFPSFWSLYIK